MKPDNVIRQPLPVATLTFLAVMVAAFVRTWITQEFAGGLPAVAAPLGRHTAALRESWPLLSGAASVVMLSAAGFLTGRSSVRAELYPVRCFLAMPLFGVAGCGMVLSYDYLTQSLTLLLIALASRNFYNSFHRHYCFDRMFRGSLYTGLLPLIYAPAVGLLLLIPLVILLFRRTLREAVVALTGALLPLFFVSFAHWAAGGGVRRSGASDRSGADGPFALPLFRRPHALFAYRMGIDSLPADLFRSRCSDEYPYAADQTA